MLQTFGRQLEALRAERGLKSKQLATRVGVTPSYITQLEKGRRDPPKQAFIARLAAALDLNEQQARLLSRGAIHERFLRAIAELEQPTEPIILAELLVRAETNLEKADFIVLVGRIQEFMDARSGMDVSSHLASLQMARLAEQGASTMT